MAVVIETTVGDITVDLFTDRRPQTCKNFLKLCKLKYYNFCLFHSIQANFIAQTGDPTGVGTGGESIFGVVYGSKSKYYEAEKVPKIKHDKAGLLSMVNCGNNMLGSQFFVTLSDDLQSLEEHCVFAEVTEGHEILVKLNDAICDNLYRPYQDIRITHTVILDDPFEDIPGMIVPIRSPDVSKIHASNGRIGADEKINDLEGLTETQLNDLKAEREAKARATILEIVGDLPHADVAPPENVLFVCKLNPVTTDDDLEIIFSRFGKIKSCEVIRDHQTGDSLQYAFIEFEDQKACEQAYLKMDNVLIDDRRIHVDFSQSVSKIKWRGKGRGVQYIDTKDDESSHYSDRFVSKRDSARDKDGRDNRDRNDRRRDDDRSRRRTERESEDRRRRDRRKEEPRRRDEENWRESERYEEERKRREQLREERRRDEERRYSRREERRREDDRRRDLEKKRSNGSERKHKESSRRSEVQVESKKDDGRSKDDIRVTDNNRVRPVEIKRDNSATTVKEVKSVEVPLKKSHPEPEPSKPNKKEPPVKEEAINNVSSSSNDTPKLNHAINTENDASDSVSLDKVDSMSAKVPEEKDRKKKKRKRTSTSSASSSSESSASTTSSSSVDRKKKSKRSLTVAKKYYHRGKLVKVVKKKKRKSSDSESLSESSDSDRKKKKSKYSKKVVKVIKKKRRHSSDDSDSDSSSSDDSDSSRYSRRRRKKRDRNNKKKRKDSGKKTKNKKKGQNSSDESSGSEDGGEARKK